MWSSLRGSADAAEGISLGDLQLVVGIPCILPNCMFCALLVLARAFCHAQLSLRGSADATEGISLDDLKLVVGQAQLSAKGLLGGKQQDAVFSLTDFPAVLLQPLFSALPALQVRLCFKNMSMCAFVAYTYRTGVLHRPCDCALQPVSL